MKTQLDLFMEQRSNSGGGMTKDYIKNIHNAERRYISNLPEIRAAEADSKMISGLGIVYNRMSGNLAPWMPGGLYEIIEPGAAHDLLEDEDIMILFNHDPNLVLARNKNTATLRDTNEGVVYEFETPNTTVGNDLRENIRVKNVRKSSFAFLAKDVRREQGEMEGIGKVNVRRVVKFERFFDFSPVTYPAYEDTEVAVRSFQQMIEQDYKEAELLRSRRYKHMLIEAALYEL